MPVVKQKCAPSQELLGNVYGLSLGDSITTQHELAHESLLSLPKGLKNQTTLLLQTSPLRLNLVALVYKHEDGYLSHKTRTHCYYFYKAHN